MQLGKGRRWRHMLLLQHTRGRGMACEDGCRGVGRGVCQVCPLGQHLPLYSSMQDMTCTIAA